jgi:hypothetical protein
MSVLGGSVTQQPNPLATPKTQIVFRHFALAAFICASKQK